MFDIYHMVSMFTAGTGSSRATPWFSSSPTWLWLSTPPGMIIILIHPPSPIIWWSGSWISDHPCLPDYCRVFTQAWSSFVVWWINLLLVKYYLEYFVSRRLWPLHWVLWLCAAVGVAALLVARGHYTVRPTLTLSHNLGPFFKLLLWVLRLIWANFQVDVVIAYFVTTRLWFLHNSIINHRQFHQRASTNFLARSYLRSRHTFTWTTHINASLLLRLWWWRLAVWFEENVRGPVPPGAIFTTRIHPPFLGGFHIILKDGLIS